MAKAKRPPAGQPITPYDCAEAALYLVSDLVVNVTGVASRSMVGTSPDEGAAAMVAALGARR